MSPNYRCVVIIGNSGSGKSTLARKLQAGSPIRLLDLDTIAWEKDPPPRRRARITVERELRCFCEQPDGWIAEGCYGDLAEFLLQWKPLLLFMNPGTKACLENCHRRPWEPHKYPSKEAQDAGLGSLLDWVGEYETRDDDCSLRRHQAIFDGYGGAKREFIELPKIT